MCECAEVMALMEMMCIAVVNPSQPTAAATSPDSELEKIRSSYGTSPDRYRDFFIAYATIPGSLHILKHARTKVYFVLTKNKINQISYIYIRYILQFHINNFTLINVLLYNKPFCACTL